MNVITKKSAPILLLLLLGLISAQSASAYYDPGVQRWLSRDPIEETGGLNLYGFIDNAPVAVADPLGLQLWYCTRKTEGAPLFGIGRHGYMWDDRSGLLDSERECGQEGCSGSGSKGTSSGGQGPTPGGRWGGTVGSGGGWSNGSFECSPIPGSSGQEQEIMDFCRSQINHRPWLPPFWDCHTSARWCLNNFDLDLPPFRRWNHHPPFGGPPALPVRPPKWPYGFMTTL
jgi:hypothetical protein